MLSSFIILFICALLAFSLSAVCGGGAGLILMPVLGAFLPVTYVPVALSIGTFSSSFSRIIVFYSKIRWDIVRWFVPAALPAVWLGAWLLSYVNPMYIQLLMGLFLVINLPQIFKTPKPDTNSKFLPAWVLLFIGFLTGFVSGLTGAVGLLFNRFYFRYGLSKEEIVATRSANEIILHLIKLCLYASFGIITAKVISLGIAVAVAAIISSFCMKWILPRLSESVFRKVGYTAMVLSGFFMLAESGNRISNAKNINLSFTPVSDGLETRMQWKSMNIAFEFTYDEGFEYEQIIPFSDLPVQKQSFVRQFSKDADHVVIEEVFGRDQHFYELYVTRKGAIKKFDF
ncbi:hypothetical protein SAMN04515674_1087 [Pseudarcicella hirudinis]|uniref:Probable membrane transporter protein n=1 Tax=Pseudarcicella hirudinis TaxID=1079859 RepID=A0A1I5UQ32_9BACT|nr:hypothetical protein SAMN04515674_1087 [Pseudarcicella hirudinis]